MVFLPVKVSQGVPCVAKIMKCVSTAKKKLKQNLVSGLVIVEKKILPNMSKIKLCATYRHKIYVYIYIFV